MADSIKCNFSEICRICLIYDKNSSYNDIFKTRLIDSEYLSDTDSIDDEKIRLSDALHTITRLVV